MSTMQSLRVALRERYPEKKIPYGEQAKLAREFKCTRALVNKVARSLEFESFIEEKLPPQCSECERPSIRGGLCSYHLRVHLRCNLCGAPVSRLRSEYNNRLKSDRYTGKVYCDRTCFGRYIGRKNKKVTA